ncbi:hypothetical protein V8E52_001887 [Russula decolorans]
MQLPLGTAAHRMANLDQVHKLLDEGYSNIPQPQDTKNLMSRRSSACSTSCWAPINSRFLMAKELKRQSWCFHVKYLTPWHAT